jgi:hypothetical protein
LGLDNRFLQTVLSCKYAVNLQAATVDALSKLLSFVGVEMGHAVMTLPCLTYDLKMTKV